jgi:hypothetical protein
LPAEESVFEGESLVLNKAQSRTWHVPKTFFLLSLITLPSMPLSALQAPVVPVRNMAYVVKYDDGGTTREVRTNYKCYFEDVSWVSDRGAAWHVRFEDLLRVKGSLPDGIPYEVQPIDKKYVHPSSDAWCPDHDLPNRSVLFLRHGAGTEMVAGFDDTHIVSPSHTIRILDSSFKPEGSGLAAFQPLDTSANHVYPSPGPTYYTISAEFLPGSEIDRRQLRAYVTQRQDLRLLPGQSYEFKDWGPEDVAAATKYYGKLDPASPADFANIGQKTANGEWVIERTSNRAIQWYPQGKVESDLLKLLGHPESIPRQWVTYKQSRIQLPIAVYNSRYFYDPSSDELVIFQVHHVELTPP